MSQLNEIIDNHQNLDYLTAILRHHGISAEFVTSAVLDQFQSLKDEEKQDKERVDNIVTDLEQFYARL